MSHIADELLKRSLSLGESNRASSAGALIEGLDVGTDEQTDQAWDIEIQRCIQQVKSCSVDTILWSKVRQTAGLFDLMVAVSIPMYAGLYSSKVTSYQVLKAILARRI